MNKLLRIISVLLALALSMTMLFGCGSSANDDGTVSGDNQSDNGGSTADDGEDEIEALEPSLTIDGEAVDISSNPVMINIGGIDIPFDEFRYVYIYYAASRGISSDLWESDPDLFPTFLEIIVSACKETCYGELLANKYNISLTDSDMDEIALNLANESAQFESQEEYEQALKDAGITEDLLERLITKQVLGNRAYLELYGGENPQLIGSDEDIKADISENYVRVYHLLISADHFYGLEGYEDYTDEQLAQEAKTLAEETLASIQNGDGDIYELAQTIGDDPGMIDNEEGYLFTYGMMVEPFEKASFALGVGDVSGLVETDYGWHIIIRLEQDEYVNEHFEEVRETYVNDRFNSDVNTLLAETEVTTTEYFDKLTPDSIT
ncbi:MAG TPA: peptidylprolyl isomerase [Candidatus Faeciplasma avium]|uniref:Peptidylprolyl isomerase n=1 Tax=Candidatus Faeciplasma avium TaxID=2840798 RepID=A0A9D1NQA4_9FIRM|nr:peptidylprolyl isomerase [Candidatus Faeciplasma avium]